MMKQTELYVVTSSEKYEGRIGNPLWRDNTMVYLDLGEKKVVFPIEVLERII